MHRFESYVTGALYNNTQSCHNIFPCGGSICLAVKDCLLSLDVTRVMSSDSSENGARHDSDEEQCDLLPLPGSGDSVTGLHNLQEWGGGLLVDAGGAVQRHVSHKLVASGIPAVICVCILVIAIFTKKF